MCVSWTSWSSLGACQISAAVEPPKREISTTLYDSAYFYGPPRASVSKQPKSPQRGRLQNVFGQRKNLESPAPSTQLCKGTSGSPSLREPTLGSFKTFWVCLGTSRCEMRSFVPLGLWPFQIFPCGRRCRRLGDDIGVEEYCLA